MYDTAWTSRSKQQASDKTRSNLLGVSGGRLKVLCAQGALVIIVLSVWELSAQYGLISSFLFGSPSAIWASLSQSATDGSLLYNSYVTSTETLLGFALGNAIGAIAGLLLWYWRFIQKVLHPFVVGFGSIPIIALAPLVIVWAGTGLASKVVMSTMSVVVVSLLAAYDGAINTDPRRIDLLRSLQASKWQVFRMVVVPSSLTSIFSALKLTVGFALIGAIIGEFVSSNAGLGYAIFVAGSLYRIPEVLASLLATICISLVLVYLVGLLESALLPWRKLS